MIQTILFNLGVREHKQRDYEQAIRFYNQSLKLEKNNPDAYYNRGSAYRIIQNEAQARQDLEKAAYLYNQKGNMNYYNSVQHSIDYYGW